MAFHDTKKNNR